VSIFKTLWGLLFRLFPCPTRIGLRRIGNPGRDSPVLVTCNFDLTVNRLVRALRGVDAWLLVARSKGVNVWCAAGGDEFDTESVVSAVKTSGIAGEVDHRILILPALGAPGIRATDVEQETGWETRWGPVRMGDIPRYLTGGLQRDEAMRRATYDWRERLDTALGSLFPFYFAGALGFAAFGRGLLLDYLVIGAAAFVMFFTVVPWIPGQHGFTRALLLDLPLGAILAASELYFGGDPTVRSSLIIAMSMVLLYGSELGGLASTMCSEFDPMAARLGIRSFGNVAFAGTVRTDLLNGRRRLNHDADRCDDCRQCFEVCPLGVWTLEVDRVRLSHADVCTACCACLRQCTSGGLRAERNVSAAT